MGNEHWSSYETYLYLYYYKMSTIWVAHVHIPYEEHARKFKAKDRLCWPKLIKTHKHPHKGEQILMLQQRIKEFSSLSLSTSYRYSSFHLFVLTFTLSLYFMADTVLGTTDRRKNKMKKKKTILIKLTFDKRCKQVSCHIVIPKYCLKP